MELSEGAILQHFLLERHLGEGGMGSVWAARDRRDGTSVALKVLRSDDEVHPSGRLRLLREAHATRRVPHPAIVPVVEVLEHEGTPVLVMELLHGETLRDHLDRVGRLPWREAIEVLLPIAEALALAHEAGIVHRDLKPENIFLQASESPPDASSSRIRLLDFGLARFFEPPPDATASLTGLEDLIGTIEYMAPEQALRPREADAKVDIWALGVIFYEALSAGRPLEGETQPEVLQQLLLAAITPLGVVMPELPPPLVELVMRMLARNPEKRPRDLSLVVAELRALRAWEPAELSAKIG